MVTDALPMQTGLTSIAESLAALSDKMESQTQRVTEAQAANQQANGGADKGTGSHEQNPGPACGHA